MHDGSYKWERYDSPKRWGLLLKVFLMTIVLGLAGVIAAPKVELLMTRFFPEKDTGSLRASAPEKVFDDVSVERDDALAVFVLKDEGIVKGFSDGSYRPDDLIKREEFVKLVVTALKANPHPLSNSGCFSDVGTEWFAPYVCYAKRREIVGGYEDGSFGSGKNITVAEGVSLLNKAFGSSLAAGEGEEMIEMTRGKAATMLASAMRLVR